MTTQARLHDLLPGHLSSAMTAIFEVIEAADGEVRKLEARRPDLKPLTGALFRALLPTDPIRDKQALYLAHVRELIKRVERNGAKADLGIATKAEVLGVISELSLRAPLTRTAEAVASPLFDELFPDHAGLLPGSNENADQRRDYTAKIMRALEPTCSWRTKAFREGRV